MRDFFRPALRSSSTGIAKTFGSFSAHFDAAELAIFLSFPSLSSLSEKQACCLHFETRFCVCA